MNPVSAIGPRTDEEWCRAFEPVVVIMAARVHGIGIDERLALDGYDPADVLMVLLDFMTRIVDSLPPDDAARIVQRWAVDIAFVGRAPAEVMPDARRGVD